MPRLTRDGIVDEAHRKLGVLQSGLMDPEWRTRGTQALFSIIHEENERLTGQEQPLWTEQLTHLALVSDKSRYDNGSESFLPSTVEEIKSAVLLSDGGTSKELSIISADQWTRIGDKDRTGDPEVVYREQQTSASSGHGGFASNFYLRIWPTPTSLTYGSAVTASNGSKYICIDSHTSVAENRPTSGVSHVDKWLRIAGSASYLDSVYSVNAPAWVEGTAYTATPAIQLLYRTTLQEPYSAGSQVIHMPSGWDRYITYRLAYDLSSHFAITLEERQWLKAEYLEAREALFPAQSHASSDYHNKSIFF